MASAMRKIGEYLGLLEDTGRLDETELQVGSKGGHFARVRFLERDPPFRLGHERPRVRLVEACSDEDVLDLAPQPLLPRQRDGGCGAFGGWAMSRSLTCGTSIRRRGERRSVSSAC